MYLKLGDEEVQDGEAILVNHKLPGRKVCGLHGDKLFFVHYLRFQGILQRAFWGYRHKEKTVMTSLIFLSSNDSIFIRATTQFSLGKRVFASIDASTHVIYVHCASDPTVHFHGKAIGTEVPEQQQKK